MSDCSYYGDFLKDLKYHVKHDNYSCAIELLKQNGYENHAQKIKKIFDEFEKDFDLITGDVVYQEFKNND